MASGAWRPGLLLESSFNNTQSSPHSRHPAPKGSMPWPSPGPPHSRRGQGSGLNAESPAPKPPPFNCPKAFQDPHPRPLPGTQVTALRCLLSSQTPTMTQHLVKFKEN